MRAIQLIEVTPDQLQTAILDGVKSQLEALKKDFQPKQPIDLMTRNEVKEWLKVDLSTIHNWTKKGKLKAYGISNRVYYKRHEVEQVLTPLTNGGR